MTRRGACHDVRPRAPAADRALRPVSGGARLAPLARAGALVLMLASGAACMRAGGVPTLHRPASPPEADSVTVGLWHMDETVGEQVPDAGPRRLAGVAGLDVGIDFGRFGNARDFARSLQSFVYVPYDGALETGGLLSVEAWIYVTDYGLYEDTPIAGRWTEQANGQSWLFSLVGRKAIIASGSAVTPGYHSQLVAFGAPGQVMFALQPEVASGPQSYFTSAVVELERWAHVAATFDGEVVRLYVDGRLDAQYVFRGRIRESIAPLLIGNYFDPRLLSGFESHTPVVTGVDSNPYYAFSGLIDELRISSAARAGFENARAR